MSDEDDDDVQQEAIDKIKSLMNGFPIVDRNTDIKATLKEIARHVLDTDEVYPILKKGLAGSTLDAKHIKKLLLASASTAKRINATAKDFSLRDKILKLKRIHRGALAKHLALEYASGEICYAPTFEFFYGALSLDGLVVKDRKKRARVDLNEQSTTQTKATERDIRNECEQDSTPKEVEAIYKRVKNITARQPRGAKFLQTVVDSQSFPHTVENLFHFSFLVREGKVSIKDGGDGEPVMRATDDSDETKQWNQSVLSFSMADYEEWVKKAN